MTQSSACCTPPQNSPFGGKDELARAAPTEGNSTPAVSCVSIPATAITPPVIFPLFSIAQQLENDFQQILRTILNSRPHVLLLAPAPTLQKYKSLHERWLNAWFLDVYWGKTHLECYNFFQQYEDHFATTGAKS